MVKVNGVYLDIAGKTIKEYLGSANFDTRRIVVERNMEIVPKAEYDVTVIKDNDEIEVVSFVGGG
ncbi:MAG: sulfur carrier protein ThiS [Porcipelethomonas sp.]